MVITKCIIISSRLQGYRESPLSGEFDHFLLNPWNIEQISKFIHKWFSMLQYQRIISEEEKPLLIKNLEEVIQTNDELLEISCNPLLLTLLSLLHRNGIPIPANKDFMINQLRH